MAGGIGRSVRAQTFCGMYFAQRPVLGTSKGNSAVGLSSCESTLLSTGASCPYRSHRLLPPVEATKWGVPRPLLSVASSRLLPSGK